MQEYLFKLVRIPAPKLKFNGGNISDRPINGLREFGPVDLATRKFNKIRLYLVYNPRNEKAINSFIEMLKESANELLKIDIEVKERIISDTRDLQKYLKNIEEHIESPVKDGDIIIQFLHKREPIVEKSPYFQLRIRMLGRNDPIPVQTILVSRLYNIKKPVVNNAVLGIYAKCGGKPWHLAGSVSELEDHTLYIGYDISKRMQYARGRRVSRTGTAIVYDNMGQYIYFTKYEIQTEKEVIPSESIRNFIQKVVNDVIIKGKELKALVVHRDGEIYREEVNGIVELAKRNNLSLAIISFPKASPALVDLDILDYAEAGWYMFAGKQLVRKEAPFNTFYIQTFRFYGKVRRKVNLLKYRVIHHLGIFLKSDLKKIYDDIARQIFYLSRLNWATALGEAKFPVTVHYAHKSSNLLSSGLQPRMLDEDKLFMI